jgi:hypothetical protein
MSHELISIEAGIATAGGKGDIGWVNASTPVASMTPRRKKRSPCCR